MRRFAVMLAWIVLGLAASAARADGFYFTEGAGGATVTDQLARVVPGGAELRIAIGDRIGSWAIEAWSGALIDGGPSELDMVGGDVKYLQPVSRHLELYLHGSLSYGAGQGELRGMSGRGAGFGAGVALHGKGSVLGLAFVPLFWLVKTGPQMTGALWLDDGYDFYRLRGDRPYTIDASITHLTVGFGVGTDF